MKKSLLLRGVLSIWKYPLYSLACNNSVFIKFRRDTSRRFRCQEESIGKFEAFCRLLQEKNLATVFLARISDRKWIYLIMSFFFSHNKNIEILTTPDKIGAGLIVYHNLGSVLRAKSIGENVTVSQGVTIGAGGGWSDTDKDNIPTIGNGVLIATNAIIIGNITVGDESIIGAGAVITKDVPPGVVVVGNPQRIIKKSINC